MPPLRQQVLEQLGLSMKEDLILQNIWDAILEGKDVSVCCPTDAWSEAAVLPALVRCKEQDLDGLGTCTTLVLAASPESEGCRNIIGWSKVLGNNDGTSSSLLRLLAPTSVLNDLGLPGQDRQDRQVILVVLHSKEEDVDTLRESLQLLSPPAQVVLVVNEWNDGLRQLAKEVLDDPVDVTIQPGIIQRAEEPAAQPLNKEEADAAALASYMANIICRSQDRELRAAVRAMLPKVRKRKAGCEDRNGIETGGADAADEQEDQELRAGIATMLARHHELIRHKPRGKAKATRSKNDSLPPERPYDRAGSDSECTEGSDCW